ncbi:MAG TPA: CPBP family intramembrane metalloprotease [Lachnospiraceae bacterium]|nr:CPBP family intramembrane metalloprotease [Lachnospiraceae bacterium]
MIFNRQNKEKINNLKWFDILVLTLILWGEGIYTSTVSYIALIQGATTVDDNLTFSAADNYGALALQAGLLLLALLYLWLRRFDFKAWTIRFNLKAVACGVLIFLAAALLLDIYFLLIDPLTGVLPFPGPIGAFLGSETISGVIYALLNGVYEELYFLGICLAVRKEHLKWAVLFSLLIRVSFHTYQGMLSALGIGLLFGIFMYLLYRRSKDRNLLPFFIAHATGDIFGLGILSYFWM